MTITKDQANEILVLASNYASNKSSLDSAYMFSQHEAEKRLHEKSNETWLKLKELVESITERE